MVGDRVPLVRVLRGWSSPRDPQARLGSSRIGATTSSPTTDHIASRPGRTWARDQSTAPAIPGSSARIAGARNRCESRSSAAAGTTSPTPRAGGPAGEHLQRREEERDPGEHEQPRPAAPEQAEQAPPRVSAQLEQHDDALRSAPRGRSRSSRSRPARTGWAAARATTHPARRTRRTLGTGRHSAGVGEQRRQQPGQVGDHIRPAVTATCAEAAAQPEHHHDQGGHDAAGGAAHGREHQRHRHRRARRGAGRAASGATRAPPRAPR